MVTVNVAPCSKYEVLHSIQTNQIEGKGRSSRTVKKGEIEVDEKQKSERHSKAHNHVGLEDPHSLEDSIDCWGRGDVAAGPHR